MHEKTITGHHHGSASQPKPKSRRKRRLLPIVTAVVIFTVALSAPASSVHALAASPAANTDTAIAAPVLSDSMQTLLGYVEQAEALITAANNEATALSTETVISKQYRKLADISRKMVSGLANLQNQASAVKCRDTKFKTAVDEYFHMTYDSQNALLELREFFADYFVLYENHLLARPLADNYSTVTDYYNALYTWYQAAKEGYSAIKSCPSCLTTQWKKYGEILDLNHSISYKLYLADGYKDNLRFVSAMNMSIRYDTAEELQYQELINALNGESEHFRAQGRYSFALAEEIHAYVGLEEEERNEYVFQNIFTGQLNLDYDAIETIYPSLYNSYDAFLIVKTGCISGSKKIVVEAEIPGFTQKYKESFHLDSAYKTIHIKPPVLTGNVELSFAKPAQLSLTVTEMDGTLIDAKTFPVTLKSKYDFEWYSDEYGISTKDNILCFMAPESKAIALLKRQAIEEISNMTGGEIKSFVGYQNNKWDNHYAGTYLQAAGIMRALYEMGVRYTMDTFSISGSNQHILLPDDVLEQKGGLCIETSLVVASALQSAGMHAFLVFPPRHAQVAVEVWNGSGDNPIGTGEYFLIETTAISDNWESAFQEGIKALLDYKGPGSGPITYMNQDSWQEYITREDTYLIDCDDLTTFGMTPFAN